MQVFDDSNFWIIGKMLFLCFQNFGVLQIPPLGVTSTYLARASTSNGEHARSQITYDKYIIDLNIAFYIHRIPANTTCSIT